MGETVSKDDLAVEIARALDGQVGTWDVDAIAADLWPDYQCLDAIPADVFWRAVGRHEQPDPDPAGDFQRDLSAAISKTRTDRDAIWTDGVVTVRARGISRVNQQLPQPTVQIVVETATRRVELPDTTGMTGNEAADAWETLTWETLWATVVELADAADTATRGALHVVRSTAIAHRRQEAAASAARKRRDAAIEAARAAGASAEEVAAAAEMSAPAVYKIGRT